RCDADDHRGGLHQDRPRIHERWRRPVADDHLAVDSGDHFPRDRSVEADGLRMPGRQHEAERGSECDIPCAHGNSSGPAHGGTMPRARPHGSAAAEAIIRTVTARALLSRTVPRPNRHWLDARRCAAHTDPMLPWNAIERLRDNFGDYVLAV